MLRRSIRVFFRDRNTRLEALKGIPIRHERVMSSSAVHPNTPRLRTRGAGRPNVIQALSAMVTLFSVLSERFTKAQEMSTKWGGATRILASRPDARVVESQSHCATIMHWQVAQNARVHPPKIVT